jgi:hypothetical protein
MLHPPPPPALLSHPPYSDHPDNIWQRVKDVKLFILYAIYRIIFRLCIITESPVNPLASTIIKITFSKMPTMLLEKNRFFI